MSVLVPELMEASPGSKAGLSQFPNLVLEQTANPMLREVNLAGVHIQSTRHLPHGLFQDDMQVINLVLLRVHLTFDARQRGLQEILFPLIIPNRVQPGARRVGNPLHSARARSLVQRASLLGEALASRLVPLLELIKDAPACHRQQPALERIHRRIIPEAGHLPSHRDHRFLHHFVGLRIGQAGLDGKVAHEFPVDAVKLLPAPGIIALLEPVQEARSRLDRTGFVTRHCGHHTT